MVKRITISAIIIIIVAAGFFVLLRLQSLGAFHQSENLFTGQCKTVTGITGPEDIELDEQRGIAYVSAYDRRAANAGQNVRGGIYLIDLKKPDPEPFSLRTAMVTEFQPHGISLFKVDSLTNSLLVINHRSDELHTVERFTDHLGKGFIHYETITGDELISPNDIAAIDQRRFYFTNDGRSRKKFVRSIDTFLFRSTGSIGYYNGDSFSIAETDLYFPNGIAFDSAGSRLYVTETTSGLLKVYRIEEDKKNITKIYEQDIGTGVDNINTDREGNIWIARHPNLHALSRHMAESVNISPSQVLRLEPAGESFVVNLAFSDDGKQISGASAAIFYNNRILIGAAFDDKLLLCDM